MKNLILSTYLFFFLCLLNCKNADEGLDLDIYEKCEISDDILTKTKYHIILVMGQSNTHSGIGLDPRIDIADKKIKQLGRFGDRDLKITEAIEPLDHHTAGEGRIGFGLTFSNLYAELILGENENLIIIPCGHAGTGFIDNHWNKGDTLYNDALERTKFVLNNYDGSELKAILWHQGENDVENVNYELALDTFVQDIRSDLNSPNVPFVLGGMVPYWIQQNEDRIRLQNTIASTDTRMPRIGYADPTKPFTIKKVDDELDQEHFDATGQREMGRRYFYSFTCILNPE